MEFKICKHCGETKPASEFGQFYCKSCKRELSRQWQRDNAARRRMYYLERAYGIKPQEFKRLIKAQNGRCSICERLIKTGGGRRHANNNPSRGAAKSQGLICKQCNTGLSFFRADPSLLLRAINYLR